MRNSKKTTPSRLRRRIARFTKRFESGSNPSSFEEGRNSDLLCERLTFQHLPYRLEGVEVKRSQRWIDGPQITSEYAIPYIDKWGFISGSSFATVRCSPQQYIATITSTVARRFSNIAIRKTPHSTVVRYKDLLIKAAYYYAVSKNDWFRSRIVELCKNITEHHKTIYGLAIRFMATTDDYTRFVYSQVCYQTNWLFSRGLGPRDKSILERFSSTFRASGLKEKRLQFKAIRYVSVRIHSMCPTRCNRPKLPKPSRVKGESVDTK